MVVIRRQAGDRLEDRMEELGEALGADIWYPADQAMVEVTADGQLLAVPAGGGDPAADLWQTYESRSLREPSGVGVPT
jgi:hypothetical protein